MAGWLRTGSLRSRQVGDPERFWAPQWSNLTTRGFLRRSHRTEFGDNQNFMKPIPQIDYKQRGSPRDDRGQCSQRNLPLTDQCYQASVDAKSSSSAVLPARRTPAFHKLSGEFFGGETRRDYLAELLAFILITGISVWPIISAMIAVTRMVRNY